MEVARAVMAAILGVAALAAQTPTDPDLREGIALTSQGRFDEAIPRFVAAQGRGVDSFALQFNLALCYVGIRRFPDAIRLLSAIPPGPRSAEVKDLLAQAYVGDHQAGAAWKTFQEAASLAPDRERLYLLVSQACLDEGLTDMGMRVVETGLKNLPGSARLHFQRGIFDSQNDDNGEARREFAEVRRLAPASEIAYIAEAEQALIEGRMADVIRSARAGIHAGYPHYLLLTMLGEALLRAGAAPSTSEFIEAQGALEQAVAERPAYSSSHVGLGRIYLTLGRNSDAIAQLEKARRLDPRNKAVYPPLAAAYQRSSMPGQAKAALSVLAELNREDAARIGAADGGHAGYVRK
ncbi:MAG TPA: tetratricopeptide repeat protein [Bryobacteraceae bacterium]|nr:tetratricopeptide repeat protein [Bryobacteraceae bacterium]